jgi:hypothetical protein
VNDVGGGNSACVHCDNARRNSANATQCDRQTPQCAVCKQANAICLPRRQGIVYNPQEPETWSFVESLQHRVARLEQVAAETQLERHASRVDDRATRETSPNHSSSDSDAVSDTNRDGAVSDNTDPAALSYALQQAARLPLNAMGEVHPEEHATPSMQSFTLRSILQAASTVSSDDPRSAKCGVHEPHSLRLSRAFQNSLRVPRSPSTRQEQDLIKDALRRCGQFLTTFLPFADASYLESVRESVHQEQVSQDEHPLYGHALVYLATAIGLLQNPSVRDHEPIAVRFAERGASLVPELLSSGVAEIPALQCLLALTVVTTLLPRFGSTWNIFGITMSRYVGSGLHSDGFRERAESTSGTEGAYTVECLYIFDT